MRAILLRANEPQILIHDDCFVGRDIELLKRVKALRAELKREPVIAELRGKANWRKLRRAGLRVWLLRGDFLVRSRINEQFKMFDICRGYHEVVRTFCLKTLRH